MTNIILSIASFTVILLIYGAYRLWRRDGHLKQPVLMVLAALVIAANVAIWTVPDDKGQSLATEAAK